jgi:hypothetical protein
LRVHPFSTGQRHDDFHDRVLLFVLCRSIPGDEVPPAVRAAVRQGLRALAGR